MLIAHRGNLEGPDKSTENTVEQIEKVLNETPFDVEIDVWKVGSHYYLGHDEPVEQVTTQFLCNPRFWIHAKNYDALSTLVQVLPAHIHVFSHDKDPAVLTSTRIPWVYPGQQVDESAIIVMPERTPDAYTIKQLKHARGICTDYPHRYVQLLAEL